MYQLETSIESAVAFARTAGSAGVRTVFNPAPAIACPDSLIALADVLVANESEAASMLDRPATRSDPAERAQAIRSRFNTGTVAITLGVGGVYCIDRESACLERSYDVPVDTTGAGDAFCAALAVRLGEGAALGPSVTFANAAGALACTVAGAAPSMPSRQPVEHLIERGVRRESC